MTTVCPAQKSPHPPASCDKDWQGFKWSHTRTPPPPPPWLWGGSCPLCSCSCGFNVQCWTELGSWLALRKWKPDWAGSPETKRAARQAGRTRSTSLHRKMTKVCNAVGIACRMIWHGPGGYLYLRNLPRPLCSQVSLDSWGWNCDLSGFKTTKSPGLINHSGVLWTCYELTVLA